MLRQHIKSKLIARGWRPPEGVPLYCLDGKGLFGYDEEPSIREAVYKIRYHTMTPFERLATLWQQVRYADRCSVPGTFVECGVWKGGAVGLMALAHRATGNPPWRHIHLYDSFQGLPQPNAEKDGAGAVNYAKDVADGKLGVDCGCVGPLTVNRELLENALGYPEELLHYHVGWFQDTVIRDAKEKEPIAILRLDGDWYDSTKVCLESLYQRVSPGGVVIIDDYGHWEGCRKAVDEFIAALQEPVLLNHVDYGARYWVRVRPN